MKNHVDTAQQFASRHGLCEVEGQCRRAA